MNNLGGVNTLFFIVQGIVLVLYIIAVALVFGKLVYKMKSKLDFQAHMTISLYGVSFMIRFVGMLASAISTKMFLDEENTKSHQLWKAFDSLSGYVITIIQFMFAFEMKYLRVVI